jgi:hypothetical protein
MLAVACSTVAPSLSPLPAGVFALPSVDTSGWDACAGVGIADAHLTGNPADSRVAWLTGSYGRKDVVFPVGFTARFTPSLEVLDRAGAVVAREGDLIDGACVTGSGAGSPVLIFWP